MAPRSKVIPFKLEQKAFVTCSLTQLHKSDRDGDTSQCMVPRKISKYPKRGYLKTNPIKVGLNLKAVRENGHTTLSLLTCRNRWR